MKRTVAAIILLVLLVSACSAIAEDWTCPKCGRINTGNFCPDCGTEKPAWTCLNCGRENFSAFCENCGAAKPGEDTYETPVESDEVSDTVAELNRMVQNGEISISGLLTMLQLTGTENVRFDGSSMEDTIENGEITVVSMLEYGSIWFSGTNQPANVVQEAPRVTYGLPGMLDIVLCRYPARGEVVFIKRIVGLPGDTVELREGFLYINGQQVEAEKELINPEYRVKHMSDGYSFGPYYIPKKGDSFIVTTDQDNKATYWINGEKWERKMTCLIANDDEGNPVKIYNRKVDAQSRSAQMETTEVVISYKGEIMKPDEWVKAFPDMIGKELIVGEDYYFIMGDHRNNSNDSRNFGVLEKSAILGHVERVIYPFNKAREIK